MKYEKIKYPDGQISVKILEQDETDIEIRERINSYEDLFHVKSIVDAIQDSYKTLSLYIPCMFGQRSDRRFSDNQSFDLRLICDFINTMGFNDVRVFDPHSDVTLALLDNSRKIISARYVADSIRDMEKKGRNDAVLVSPDAGAYKKVFEYGHGLGYEVVAAVKHRDLEGTIDLKFMGDVKDKHCLIVDDLCDGGYTFLLLGRALKAQGAKTVSLYISHGYFSKGFDELRTVIDHIYCTNSVKDLGDVEFDGVNTHTISDYVTQFKVI